MLCGRTRIKNELISKIQNERKGKGKERKKKLQPNKNKISGGLGRGRDTQGTPRQCSFEGNQPYTRRAYTCPPNSGKGRDEKQHSRQTVVVVVVLVMILKRRKKNKNNERINETTTIGGDYGTRGRRTQAQKTDELTEGQPATLLRSPNSLSTLADLVSSAGTLLEQPMLRASVARFLSLQAL